MGKQPRGDCSPVGGRASVLVRVAKLLEPLNLCCRYRISLVNGGARGFDASGLTAAGLVGW